MTVSKPQGKKAIPGAFVSCYSCICDVSCVKVLTSVKTAQMMILSLVAMTKLEKMLHNI